MPRKFEISKRIPEMSRPEDEPGPAKFLRKRRREADAVIVYPPRPKDPSMTKKQVEAALAEARQTLLKCLEICRTAQATGRVLTAAERDAMRRVATEAQALVEAAAGKGGRR